MEWLAVLIAAIISGLLGVVISLVYYRRHEKYLRKLQTLKDVVGYRYDLKSEAFTRAMNEIFIVFSDSTKVKQALKKFYENTMSPTRSATLSDQYFVELFKSMCEDLNIKTVDFTDSFFLSAFNVRRGTTSSNNQIPPTQPT